VRIQHEAVLGRTRSGKTYYAAWRADQFRRTVGGAQVIFFDTKGTGGQGAGSVPGQWVMFDRRYALRDMEGDPLVWYVPSADQKVAQTELEVLTQYAMQMRDQPTVVVVDEAQVWAGSGQRSGPVQKVARQGAGEPQVMGIFTAQRPADLAKGVLTQCERVVVFRIDDIWESSYWERVVSQDVLKQVQRGTQKRHHYVVLEGGEVSDPRKV